MVDVGRPGRFDPVTAHTWSPLQNRQKFHQGKATDCWGWGWIDSGILRRYRLIFTNMYGPVFTKTLLTDFKLVQTKLARFVNTWNCAQTVAMILVVVNREVLKWRKSDKLWMNIEGTRTNIMRKSSKPWMRDEVYSTLMWLELASEVVKNPKSIFLPSSCGYS